MHGAGNSFLLVENLHGELQGKDLSILALKLCNPETGPGADGLIVIVPPATAVADFGMLFYNSDGSQGEMCGNGARCLARYGVEHDLCADAERICFETAAGPVFGRRISRELYEVRLNDPSVIDLQRNAAAGGETVRCSYVELGCPGIPHAVVVADESVFDDPDTLRERARILRHSPSFPKGANVTHVSLLARNRVRAVTFERGVEDFTLACGTGCGAVAVSLILSGRVPGNSIEVDMPGGHLSVHLRRVGGSATDILLIGPTAIVEDGDVPLEI